MLALLISLSPAQADQIQVGAGIQSTFNGLDNPGSPDGIRLAGRYRLLDGVLTMEGGLYVKSPFAPSASSLTTTLVQIGHQGDPDAAFQQPFRTDDFGVHVAADLAPIPDAWEDGVTCSPHVLAGMSFTKASEYYATYNQDYISSGAGTPVALSVATTHLDLRPLVGVGFDAWYDGRVGLRLLFQARPGLERQPDYDPDDDSELEMRFTMRTAMAFDLLVGF